MAYRDPARGRAADRERFRKRTERRRAAGLCPRCGAWRNEVGITPYVSGITFSGEVIDLGNAVEVVLSHPDPERLAGIASSLADNLRGIAGVFDVRSDHTSRINEIQLELRREARTLGLTEQTLALQARAAIFGAEVERVQRGRDEVRVFVR